MERWILLGFLFLAGCATLPNNLQPAVNEPYAVIKSKDGVFFENIDDKHFSLGLYGYGGDIRLTPGDHIIGLHFDSVKFVVHCTGSKESFPIHVEEGKRYYIGVNIIENNFCGGPWKPIIVKVEDIEGYVKRLNK